MWRGLLMMAGALVILSLCTGFRSGLKDPNLRALRLCQETIKGLSKDYNKTEVPYARNYGRNGEAYFAWNNRNPIKLADGRGGVVIVSGSCIVDTSSESITSLTINAKQIIPAE